MEEKKIPDSEKWKELLKNSPFVDKNISHENFVNGIKKGTIKIEFNIKDIDVYSICEWKKQKILGIIHLICFLITPVLIILFSIIYSNWWLLLGLPIWYLATIITHHSGYKISAFILIIAIGGWFAVGFHFQSYLTFFSLTFIFSQMFAGIESEYDKMFLTQVLVEDSKKFDENRNKIILIRKSK